MSIRLNESLDDINTRLNEDGKAIFYIVGPKQTVAQVVIEGGHEVTMTARIMGKHAVRGVGTATIYRYGRQPITEFVLASAFGTAYARAVDPKPAPQTRYIDGTIDLGDFVECGALNLRGVVVDVLAQRSARKGECITGYVINTGDGETTVSVDHTRLLMKGL